MYDKKYIKTLQDKHWGSFQNGMWGYYGIQRQYKMVSKEIFYLNQWKSIWSWIKRVQGI